MERREKERESEREILYTGGDTIQAIAVMKPFVMGLFRGLRRQETVSRTMEAAAEIKYSSSQSVDTAFTSSPYIDISKFEVIRARNNTFLLSIPSNTECGASKRRGNERFTMHLRIVFLTSNNMLLNDKRRT
jgi:hypothetical protein